MRAAFEEVGSATFENHLICFLPKASERGDKDRGGKGIRVPLFVGFLARRALGKRPAGGGRSRKSVIPTGEQKSHNVWVSRRKNRYPMVGASNLCERLVAGERLSVGLFCRFGFAEKGQA